MLLLRIVIFIVIILLFYPFLFYVSIDALGEATRSNFEQIVLPILINLAAMLMCASVAYNVFYEYALKKRIVGKSG